MSTTSDSDSDSSNDPEGLDPRMKAVFKAMDKAYGGEIMSIGPKYNHRLNSIWYNEPNATRRLLQLLIHTEHWYNLSVERELEKPDKKTPNLPIELKKRLEAVNKVFKNKYERDLHSDEDGYNSEEYVWQHWTPILMNWELYKGHAQNNSEMGELVFAHQSNKQFVIVNLCGPRESADGKERYYEDYETRLLSQAHRFLALLHYLPLDTVEWVRATYITTDYRKLQPKLFDYSLSTQPAQGDVPPLFHLTPDMVKKCLTEKDLAAPDTYMSVCEFVTPGNKVKAQALVPDGAVDPTAVNLKWFDVNLGQSPLKKKCDGCDRLFAPTQLKACSACRSVLYCSQSCQKASWKLHKMGQCR